MQVSAIQTKDDQIEIVDYSDDPAARALFMSEIDDPDDENLVTINLNNNPELLTLPNVINYLHDHHNKQFQNRMVSVKARQNIHNNNIVELNDIYGQHPKYTKLIVSEDLYNYPSHNTTNEAFLLQQLQHSTADTSDKNDLRSLSSLQRVNTRSPSSLAANAASIGVHKNLSSLGTETIQNDPNAHLSVTNTTAVTKQLTSIQVTHDGDFTATFNLSNNLCDLLYDDITTALGTDFSQAVEHNMTGAFNQSSESNGGGGKIGTGSQYQIKGNFNSNPSPLPSPTNGITPVEKIDLTVKSTVTPATGVIAEVPPQQYRASPQPSSSAYQQPTYHTSPANIGSSLGDTKPHEQLLYIENIDEPISKTTFEQLTFLNSFWGPQLTKYMLCTLIGVIVATVTFSVETFIGYLTQFFYFVLESILQSKGGITGWEGWENVLYPVLAFSATTMVAVLYWTPGVMLVYYGGLNAVRGSGLPALSAYFDGSYDPSVPLFGGTVLLCKLLSVGLSLGALYKGGLQGVMIVSGAMMGRTTLKATLAILNVSFVQKAFAYLLCCFFDKNGHSRKKLMKKMNPVDLIPVNIPYLSSETEEHEGGEKRTVYLQSEREIDDEAAAVNNSDYQQVNDDESQSIDVNIPSDGNYGRNNADLSALANAYTNNAHYNIKYGTEQDVNNEMVNRINILAKQHNMQHLSYGNNINPKNSTPDAEINNTRIKSYYVPEKPQPRIISAQSTPFVAHQAQYKYNESSTQFRATTHLTDHPENDYQTVESLTLSKRIELIIDSLSSAQDEYDVLACGATAGFAAAFNAPFAGIIFIQGMLKQQNTMHLTLRIFYTALVTVIISNFLRGSGLQLPDRGFVDLDIPPVHTMNVAELFLCAVFGVFGGYYGVIIIKTTVWLTKMRMKFLQNRLLPNLGYIICLGAIVIIPGVIISTGITGCTPINADSFPICQSHPQRCSQLHCPAGTFSQFGSLIFGNPSRLLRLTWDRSLSSVNEFDITVLVIFTIIYFVLSLTSLIAVFPGGFFVPGLVLGATFFRILARLTEALLPSLFPGLQHGIYATLGSVAVLSCVNRTTLPAIAMMVEFTSDTQFLVPMMIVLLCSKLVADFYCLGLDQELAKLTPKVSMSMGDNPPSYVLGNITATDILKITHLDTLKLNKQVDSNGNTPTMRDVMDDINTNSHIATVGEIDTIYRIKALLDTTNYSAFPVVTVLPSTLNQHCTHLPSTLAQRIYNRNVIKTLYANHNINNTDPASQQKTLTQSLAAMLGQGNNSALNDMIEVLQSNHDDMAVKCQCHSIPSVSTASSNTAPQPQRGQLVGLVTRAALQKIIEKSVDYNALVKTLVSPPPPQEQAAAALLNQARKNTGFYGFIKHMMAFFETQQVGQDNVANSVDSAASMGGDETQADGTRNGITHEKSKTKKGQCICLKCVTKKYPFTRYNIPLLSLLQHSSTKQRIMTFIAVLYYHVAYNFKNLSENKKLPVGKVDNVNTVLLHREILSAIVNYISTTLIALPLLPRHIRNTIQTISFHKQQQYQMASAASPDHRPDPTQNVYQQLPPPQPKEQLNIAQKCIKYLENRSQILHSLKKQQNINTGISLTADNMTLTKLSTSFVNILPLIDKGVYCAAYNTSGTRMWRLFRSVGMTKMVIINEQQQPIGIITRKDMIRMDKYLASQLTTFRTKLDE